MLVCHSPNHYKLKIENLPKPKNIWYLTLDELNQMKYAYFKIHPDNYLPPHNNCQLKSALFVSILFCFVLFCLNIGFTSSIFPIQSDFSQNQLAVITLNTGSPRTLIQSHLRWDEMKQPHTYKGVKWWMLDGWEVRSWWDKPRALFPCWCHTTLTPHFMRLLFLSSVCRLRWHLTHGGTWPHSINAFQEATWQATLTPSYLRTPPLNPKARISSQTCSNTWWLRTTPFNGVWCHLHYLQRA